MSETLLDFPVINTDSGCLNLIRESVSSGVIYPLESYSNMNFFDRLDMIREFGYVVPTTELVKCVKKHSSNILSIGSGRGYLEHIFQLNEINTIATDICEVSKNPYFMGSGYEKSYCPIEIIDGYTAISKYCDRTIFMAWPPENSIWPKDIFSVATNKVIFIGESFNGHTGHNIIHEILESRFELIDKVDCVSFEGINESIRVYQLMYKL